VSVTGYRLQNTSCRGQVKRSLICHCEARSAAAISSHQIASLRLAGPAKRFGSAMTVGGLLRCTPRCSRGLLAMTGGGCHCEASLAAFFSCEQSAAGGVAHDPHLSLRGAQRRGNLKPSDCFAALAMTVGGLLRCTPRSPWGLLAMTGGAIARRL